MPTDTPAHTKDRTFIHKKPPKPDVPAPFTEAQAYAIQQLIQGKASAHQQKLGMEWIITQASMAYIPAIRDTDRESNIAMGRAFVGQQIIGLAQIPLIGFMPEIDHLPEKPAPAKPTTTRKKKEK